MDSKSFQLNNLIFFPLFRYEQKKKLIGTDLKKLLELKKRIIMLYIVKSFGPRDHSILKVGFTNNIERRFYQYVSSAPENQLITTRKGDTTLESLIHKYLQFLGLQYNKNGRRLEEWFINDPEVLRVFHLSRETIERFVWKNRDRIFDVKIFNSPDYVLFKYLYEKYIDNFEGEEYRINNRKLYKTPKRVDLDFWKLCKKADEPIKGFENADPSAIDFLSLYYSTGNYLERMKAFCGFMDSHKDQPSVVDFVLRRIDPKFNNLYQLLGTKVLRACKYRESLCEAYYQDKINNRSKSSELKSTVRKAFIVGKRYTNAEAKEMLRNIYNDIGYKKSPKATDLWEWFNLKRVYFNGSNGFEIISIKP